MTATASTPPPATPRDGLITEDRQEWYRIADVDAMPPFLISVVSAADHWMYVSSRGGLTAGRVNEDGALFPYETDDKLHQSHSFTGPYTLIRIRSGDRLVLWEPFREPIDGRPIRRNLFKNVPGNQLLFEEVHEQLGLIYRYRWANSDDFGFVRTVTLENTSRQPIHLDVIDGLLNLMPANVPLTLQRNTSCLVNAYTRCDVDPETRLATIALSAMIVDQAMPVESLRASIVWCAGLADFCVLLSTDQFAAFRLGKPVTPERVLKGRRGNYFVSATLDLQPGESRSWDIIADIDRGHQEIESLRSILLVGEDIRQHIAASIRAGTDDLLRNIASADGLQSTADRIASTHHYANVMFNNMRGGVFAHNCSIPAKDFCTFVRERNIIVHHRHEAALKELDAEPHIHDLFTWAQKTQDVDLLRLCYEYLPITFSRRHGDPSRPWNHFNIRLKNPDGSRALTYQGNWRDIFQNWEALCLSFPCFLENVIAKFVNASTVDGFNPYRIGRDGIGWETPEPENPFSNIGYWGDHQIIYLLRLLESSRRHRPGILEGMLTRRLFTYAEVPYRLREYAAIVANPRSTISFDRALDKQLAARAEQTGADGKLVHAADGAVYHVTLAEKLLVPILAKLSNLVLDGGIWLNTQRPEWNDANNALVGNGLSMVTLAYLRRHLAFCRDLFAAALQPTAEISVEVNVWLQAVIFILRDHRAILESPRILPAERRRVLDALGEAFCNYRRTVYATGFSDTLTIPLTDAIALFDVALPYLDHAIAANRRADGLYHSYNLLDLSPAGEAKVEHLYEMLEGQVAVLSAGVLSPAQAADLVDALYKSRMFRADQNSFMLYPERELPAFLEKNIVPPETARAVPLLAELLDAGNPAILARDAFGHLRFNSRFRSLDDVSIALTKLAADARWAGPVAQHRDAALQVFAAVFGLRSFTGRSGTMYGYEGLGCIYWHMVAKLLLAVQENFQRAAAEDPRSESARRLATLYYRVREGLGFSKSARAYGAFPTDPYSHTPRHAGAQQPGMTGQVKEEIITRFGELGISIDRGRIRFHPHLLRRHEFFADAPPFDYVDIHDHWQTLSLEPHTLAFTFCQVPIVYHLTTGTPRIRAVLNPSTGNTEKIFDGLEIDRITSRGILSRTGEVLRLEVDLPESQIFVS